MIGTGISLWSVAAVLSGLAQVDRQVSELIRQYLVASAVLQGYHTSVDFYTYIKGAEYIVCIVFLGFFWAFYSNINRTKENMLVR